MFILLSNLSTLIVPDDGYSREASSALYLISTFLLLPTFSICHLFSTIEEA
jgi:hypothetical protein